MYGSSLGEGDGTAIVELPSNVLRVTLARVGDTEYFPTTTGYTQYLDGAINLFTVAWDPSESAYLCTFSEEIADEADVEFVGNLSATELDPDDAGEDGTVLDVDDRFRNAIVYFCLDRALRGTEDDHRRFRELYLEELQRFGFRAKLARIAQFHQPEKKSHNRCSW